MNNKLWDPLTESNNGGAAPGERKIFLCGGVPCSSVGCLKVKEAVIAGLKSRGLLDRVEVEETGCIGNCSLGPTVIVYPEGAVYRKVQPDDAAAIIDEHVVGGRIVERLLYRDPRSDELHHRREDMPFYRGQLRIALRNCGEVRPHIETYMQRRGYTALVKVLGDMPPEAVIDEIKRSGLRGRGGAGFPTGVKWEYARRAAGERKYVIGNGDEGDPGAFMDRSILEGDPHTVLEGMIIAGYAIGAQKGYLYVRAEYPLAGKRVEEAIAQARKHNLLGDNILDKDFSFDIEIRIGAGAFVCGEETALIRSIEGSRGDPSQRPPFPAQQGLWERPTLINNVETLACVPPIILKGAGWYSSIGTKESKGTKVFALAGKVEHTGLIEVPMGTTLRRIIFDIGGGIPGGKQFKAVQTGGPSGGCLSAAALDLPVEYESLAEAGSIMGSGGMIVMDEDTCMVDVARYFIDFSQDESCGKCTPCRVGSKRLLEILERIANGDGREGDLEQLTALCMLMKNTSLCGLGRSAPNPVLSTLANFRAEFEAHIRDKRCPAGVCKGLSH